MLAANLSRRDALRVGLAAAALSSARPFRAQAEPPAGGRGPLRLALLGAGRRGVELLQDLEGATLVAVADPDAGRRAALQEAVPGLHAHADYRRLLETEAGLEGVLIATPDHHHVAAALSALAHGLPVYLEKPAAKSVHEARRLADAVAGARVPTQHGTQGVSSKGFGLAVAALLSGRIGEVRQVHAWTDRPRWAQGCLRPLEQPPVPEGLDWDTWIGPSAARPYHPAYHPVRWRGWWDFGTGALGDGACHILALPFHGLALGSLERVEPLKIFAATPESPPRSSVLRFTFADASRRSTTVTWYDGGERPATGLVPADLRPETGCLVVGTTGSILTLDRYGTRSLRLEGPKPVERFEGGDEPSSARRHLSEWIRACRDGSPTSASLARHAPLIEAVAWGNVSVRSGTTIEVPRGREEAGDAALARWVRPGLRPGWRL